MAQNVIGLDLGSHTVKLVVVNMGLRGSEIVKFETEPVKLDSSGNSSQKEVFEAAKRLIEARADWTASSSNRPVEETARPRPQSAFSLNMTVGVRESRS